MSAVVAHDILREYAGRRWPTLNHKGRIARLAGVLGLGHRRVRSLYQNEPGLRVHADEADLIQALRGQQDAVETPDVEARIAALEAQVSALRLALALGERVPVGGTSDRQGGTVAANGFRNE